MGNGQKPAWTGKEAKLLQQDIQRVGDPVRLKIAMRGFFSDEIPGVKEFVEEHTGYTYAAFHGVLERIVKNPTCKAGGFGLPLKGAESLLLLLRSPLPFLLSRTAES